MINFYKYKKKIGVVEVFVEGEFSLIKDKLSSFRIEDKSLPQDNWQVLYMEQYFTKDRSSKLCETYEEPAENVKGFLLVFFIYELGKGQLLQTPLGNVVVSKLGKLPREYKKTLEYETMD